QRCSSSRWLLAPWAAATARPVTVRCTPVGELRYLLCGNWYSDHNRITAPVAVAAVPVLALGIESLQRWAGRSRPAPAGTAGQVAAGVVAVLVLALGTVSPGTRVNDGHFEAMWRSETLLSADERELLAQLPDVVDEDAV